MDDLMMVIWKDGSWAVHPKGHTWEYEEDADWLTTVPVSEIVASKPEGSVV